MGPTKSEKQVESCLKEHDMVKDTSTGDTLIEA